MRSSKKPWSFEKQSHRTAARTAHHIEPPVLSPIIEPSVLRPIVEPSVLSPVVKPPVLSLIFEPSAPRTTVEPSRQSLALSLPKSER